MPLTTFLLPGLTVAIIKQMKHNSRQWSGLRCGKGPAEAHSW